MRDKQFVPFHICYHRFLSTRTFVAMRIVHLRQHLALHFQLFFVPMKGIKEANVHGRVIFSKNERSSDRTGERDLASILCNSLNIIRIIT